MKIIIIICFFILSSCSSIIINQGFKEYKSTIEKTDKYKKSNSFQKDILYLNDLMENSFPKLNETFPPNKREAILDSLLCIMQNKNISKNEFVGYIRFFLAHLKNQHSSISGLKSNLLFPFVLHPYNNSWYLLNINKEYDSLLIGKKVIAIEEISIKQIENKLGKYVFTENDICTKHKIKNFINRPDLLKQFNIISTINKIKLTFEDCTSIIIKSISQDNELNFWIENNRFEENELTKYINHNYHINVFPQKDFAYFQFNKCHDKIDTYESMKDYLKPWAIPFAKFYIKKQILKKDNQKLHGYIDVERPIFKDYLNKKFDSLKALKINNLIIDLRNNSGGSTLLTLQLLYYLTDNKNIMDYSELYNLSNFNKQIERKKYTKVMNKYFKQFKKYPQPNSIIEKGFFNCDSMIFEPIVNKKSPYFIKENRPYFSGNIFILANQNTGSAAALFAALLQDNNLATIIGVNVGNNPTGATLFRPFKLPNTGYEGSIATGYLMRPENQKGKLLAPDYWVENSALNIINGIDKPLQKAIELINSQNR